MNPLNSKPFIFRIARLIVLGMLIMAIMRFWSALTYRSIYSLTQLPELLRFYLIGSGLMWSMVFLPTAWGLWARKPWAIKATWAATIFFLLSYWAERIFLWENVQNTRTWLFYYGLSILWVIINLITFRLNATKRFLNLGKDASQNSESIKTNHIDKGI
ncbi:MAG: hypothetical protein MUO40_12705 [Anaerolineaceae bacterium]|nr:hypothetical protein [Anaerolineaceae bacterium]